jgi:hypothetical protein
MVAGWLALASAATCQADGVAPETIQDDKSEFHLSNPTPNQIRREMTTDGPGAAESPFTVDSGHIQIELSFALYGMDQNSKSIEPQPVKAFAIEPVLIKIGILNRLDAQLGVEPYQEISEGSGAERTTIRGSGDTTLRLKYNLWGDDGGATAAAIMPFVRLPSNEPGIGSGRVEGGVIVPFETELPSGFYLDVTSRLDFAGNQPGKGYHLDFMNSLALHHKLFGDLAGYIEFFSLVNNHRASKWAGTADAGFIYSLSDDVQLNWGANFGVTRAAEDWSLFAGIAWRL